MDPLIFRSNESFNDHSGLSLIEESPLDNLHINIRTSPRQKMEDRLTDDTIKKLCAEGMRYSPLSVVEHKLRGTISPIPDVTINEEEMRLIRALLLHPSENSVDFARLSMGSYLGNSSNSVSSAEEVAYMVIAINNTSR